jgi:chromosome segregation ATPase
MLVVLVTKNLEKNDTERLQQIENTIRLQKKSIDFLMTGLEDLKLRKEGLVSELEQIEMMRSDLDGEISSIRIQFEERMEKIISMAQESSSLKFGEISTALENELTSFEKDVRRLRKMILVPFLGCVGIIVILLAIYIVILQSII